MLKNAFFGCLLLMIFAHPLTGQVNLDDRTGHILDYGAFDYGNGWYVPSQNYIKLLAPSTGWYSITSSEIANAGFPLGNVNADNLHLYYRGKEQHILVRKSGNALASLSFYGVENDGRLDSTMYRDPYSGNRNGDLSPNPDVSLFSDTSAYYLTYDNRPGLRIQESSQNNYNAYTPEPWYRYLSYMRFKPGVSGSSWNHGGGAQYDSYQLLNSAYITAEGYVGPLFTTQGGPLTLKLKTPFHASNSGNPSKLRTRIFGRSSYNHDVEVRINSLALINLVENGVFVKTVESDHTQPLGTNSKVRFYARGIQNNNTDNNNVCWVSIEYDRLPELAGASETVVENWSRSSSAYFNFYQTGIDSLGWIYDLSTHTLIQGTRDGDSLKAIVPASPSSGDLYVFTDRAIKRPVLELPRLTNLSASGNGAEFIIIAHRRLASSANAYATYRDTNSVNRYTTKVVFTDEIYDEFGYGTFTPIAIKRFCKNAIDNWSIKPKYILLWGKGRYRYRDKQNNLVPTWGYPACDYEYVSNFDPFIRNVVPDVSIGRLNLYENDEGMGYLEKVKEYEYGGWEPWMKEAVFLGGGENTFEQQPIFDFLVQRYRTQFEGNPLGGSVHYFQNYNTGLRTNSPDLTPEDHINKGVGLIHFFGHSSNNIYDVDIQEPNQYSNFGKYPFIIAFGCYGGDFTGNFSSFGERFILERGRGTLGYFANSTAGYLSPLGNYGEEFYPVAFGTHMGQPIGDQIRESHRRYLNRFKDQLYINHAKQLNLQGDPALYLYNPQLPDLSIEQPDFFITPSNFSASDCTFTVNVVTHSLGKVPVDSFLLSIRQQLPSGAWVTYASQKHGPITNVDTLRYVIRNNLGPEMSGLNTFDIFVDSTNIINEYREDNNRLSVQVLIPGNVPAILHPREFAIVDTNRISLAAANFILNAQSAVNFIFEIDTVPEFNSPLFRSSGAHQGPAWYTTWPVPFDLQDSAVYYWRVRIADVLPASWATSSFKYIQGRTGWAQADEPQFFKDPTFQVNISDPLREWGFAERSVEMHAFTRVGENGQYRLDNGVHGSKLPANNLPGAMYTVIDGKTLAPKIQNVTNGDWMYAPLPGAQSELIKIIANAKQGDWVLILGQISPNVSQWDQTLFDALTLIGCDTAKTRRHPDNQPFIIFGRKGFQNAAFELYEPNSYDSLVNSPRWDLRMSIVGQHNNGTATSTLIGPSIGWDELIWDWKTVDPWVNEKLETSVYAVRGDNSDSLIYQGLAKGIHDLSFVDADQFPFMRLKANFQDSIYYTAPQLRHWHVVHTLAPDVAIDPITDFAFRRDTVLEGENITIEYTIQNITDRDMDSLLVRYYIQRGDRSEIQLRDRRYRAIPGDSSLHVSYTFSTANRELGGNTTFRIELNPDEDQPELYHFNNLYNYLFFVEKDKTNPIMDVTFDGKHIMNNDIVSPEPEIRIELNDENPFLAINDTAFEVYFGLKNFAGGALQRVFIQGNSRMTTQAAILPDNKAQLIFRPGQLEDGTYTLQVQGFDQTGNAAGKVSYEIDFVVENASAVSYVLNYPNPFSTSTRFAYTLTGAELPEQFELHIYTITGRLIKVIDLVELGEVKFGNNITDYAWDGRDEYGDLLANGVYLYKVVTRLNGNPMEIRETNVSQFFNNGYGKMYIMR